jgi:hypothetical protein
MSDKSERPSGLDEDAPEEIREQANVRAMESWNAVVADMEATAAEYESRGWRTLQLHPGDVAALPGAEVTVNPTDAEEETDERVGFDLLVPGDEYEVLEALIDEGAAFDAYEAFTAEPEGMVYALVAMEDRAAEVAVLFPLYYRVGDPQVSKLLARVESEGELRTYARRLSGEYVAFTHEDPSPLLPSERD